jgi:hypothetical protein
MHANAIKGRVQGAARFGFKIPVSSTTRSKSGRAASIMVVGSRAIPQELSEGKTGNKFHRFPTF